MSDIDLSDDDSFQDGQHTGDSFSPGIDENRRAHHNALERKRRDHIKDSFSSLKEVVPTLVGERSSRALILKKAVDYIATVQAKIDNHELDINALKTQNEQLEAQIRAFEGAMAQEDIEEDSAQAAQQNDNPVDDRRPVTVTVMGGTHPVTFGRTTVDQPLPVSRQ